MLFERNLHYLAEFEYITVRNKKIMRKYLLFFLFHIMLLFSMPSQAQTADSAAIVKSQQRIDRELEDAEKHQRKIEKKQKKIEKQQRKIRSQERKRERKMRKIEKEQRKLEND